MMGNEFFQRNICLRAAASLALASFLSFPAVNAVYAQDTQSAPAQDAQPAPAQAARTDADLQSDVTYALTSDPSLQGQNVKAHTSRGVVTLTGTLQTEQQRQAAETAAANVQGVSGIQNNITLSGDAGAAPEAAQQVPPPPPAETPQGPVAGNPPPPPPPDRGAPARPTYPAQGSYSPQPYSGYGSQQVSGPVNIPAGTLLQIRTSQPLDMAKLKDGDAFEATAASDVFEGNVLAVPRGALLEGTVVKAKKPGALGGSGELELQITSVNLGGRNYPLTTDIWTNKTPNKAGYTAGNTVGGSLLGALIGGAVGGGGGAAAGALVGGVGGLAASAATNGPRAILPPEALLNFHLTAPVTVQPVSWQEAQRLAQNAPQLQRRRVYMAPPYPYGYPSPYYRVYGW